MSPSKGSIFCHGKYTRTWHLQKLICCRNITTIQRKYWQKNQHATETLPTIQSSLGPGLAVGKKVKKRVQMGKISASEASGAVFWGGGMGGGAWSHAFDAAVQWYQILVSSSDWSNVFMLTYSRCCLTVSRSFNMTLLQFGKRFSKTRILSKQYKFLYETFTYPSAPRRAKNMPVICCKKKRSIQDMGNFLTLSCDKLRSHL